MNVSTAIRSVVMPAARTAIVVIDLMPRPLARIGQRLRTVLDRFAHPYRPEKHYMRGPGPKCRAKYQTKYQTKQRELRR